MPKSVKSSKSFKTYVPEAMYYNSIYPFVRGFLRKKTRSTCYRKVFAGYQDVITIITCDNNSYIELNLTNCN